MTGNFTQLLQQYNLTYNEYITLTKAFLSEKGYYLIKVSDFNQWTTMFLWLKIGIVVLFFFGLLFLIILILTRQVSIPYFIAKITRPKDEKKKGGLIIHIGKDNNIRFIPAVFDAGKGEFVSKNLILVAKPSGSPSGLRTIFGLGGIPVAVKIDDELWAVDFNIEKIKVKTEEGEIKEIPRAEAGILTDEWLYDFASKIENARRKLDKAIPKEKVPSFPFWLVMLIFLIIAGFLIYYYIL